MTNRLAREHSLYLRQHADNPVDWWPWSDEALGAAKNADQPILLSVGYSACHWCHVMAHESFEDAAIGEQMNRSFVCIKVDREERPDLDRIYQLSHQALTRRGGGWPLTVFLDPHDLVPFYAGTYFPKQPRYGMPGFADVLRGVRDWWDTRRDQVRQQNEALRDFLAGYGRDAAHAGELSDAPLLKARARIEAGFDEDNGGHQGGPKFPHAGELELLLSLAGEGDMGARRMAATTLDRMAARGLHDHLAGGFFRYCVDEHWDIPHFEKMLYDNAQLLPVYAEAAVELDSAPFREAAEGIVAWLRQEMRADGGGYCSALDADSEGEEGLYYLWDRESFDAALEAPEREAARSHYGLDHEPNFESRHWHLHAAASAAQIAQSLQRDEEDIVVELARARSRLLARRGTRIRPGRDDKRLTFWNALLASGLARAGLALAREDWRQESLALLRLIQSACDARDRLPAVIGSEGPGFLDDHAAALQASLDVLRATGEARALQLAQRLAETLLRDFADESTGGFFFTAHDHAPLPQRPKPWLDESTPAGNGLAARALQELGWLLAEPRYLDAAEACLRAGWSALSDLPQAASSLAIALREWRDPPVQVLVRGDASSLVRWRAQLTNERACRVYLLADEDSALPPALADKPRSADGIATLCKGPVCSLVTAESGELLEALRAERAR
ncbi:thioredoxin domain-containing protein [Arenimonas sp.]|uniref:thioredoxin domain-containing protein n=1 Tax=Arenimonas sp. TaxID=1872635 RepID=UPI0039E5D261